MKDRLKDIDEKVRSGLRLDFDDGLLLFETRDINILGRLADFRRQIFHGKRAYYVINHHLNYSNICAAHCTFCAFRRDGFEEDAYTFSVEGSIEKIRERFPQGPSELHIVGGLHPDLPFEYYVDLLKDLSDAFPRTTLKAFTAVEIEFLAELTGMSVETILTRLKKVGLKMLPGGGAEIFDPAIRRRICPDKADGERWLDIHRIAHKLGIPSNCTMLYGHIETPESKVDHLIKLRELQDETGGFQAFIPLSFHPENTFLDHLSPPTGLDDIRHIAISRLLLDNIPHIKAYWPMLTLKVCQVALSFGADDIDGTVVEERIYHSAGAQTPQEITVSELEKSIREAGFEAVCRDSFYNQVAARA